MAHLQSQTRRRNIRWLGVSTAYSLIHQILVRFVVLIHGAIHAGSVAV
jgi:hypothetical protein